MKLDTLNFVSGSRASRGLTFAALTLASNEVKGVVVKS